MRTGILALFSALALALGCTAVIGSAGGSGIAQGSAGAASSAASAGSSSARAASAGAANAAAGASGNPGITTVDPGGTGVPCEVTALLEHYCVGCHSSPPAGGAPQSMLSYADLTATATLDASKSIGVYSVTLMQTGVMPPKPAAPPSAAEQATFAAWVSAGMPKQGCTTPIDAGIVSTDPYDTPLTCTSGTTWTRGDRGSASMHPGVACIACHVTDSQAPSFAIAGTVFPSAHEPDDCNGVATSSLGALSVLITEATGTTHKLSVDSSGNFSYQGSLATPYTAQVNAGSVVRVMTQTQTSGDCNGCHTVNGSSTIAGAISAPGRIMAP